MSLKDRRIAFIGGGNITEIIVANLTKTARLIPRRLIISDPIKEKVKTLQSKYAVSTAGDNVEAVIGSDFVFINVLPHVVAEVVREFQRVGFPPDKVIITVAAGIPVKTYEVLGDQIPVVQALPNPPSRIGRGISALAFNRHVQEERAQDILELFSCLGKYVVVKEMHINTVMALSSPIVTYLLFQSLIDAGVRAGLDRGKSTKVVYQTITGAMEVWKIRQTSPYELVSEASTPGGISIESLFTLETHALKAAIMETIDSAIKLAEKFSRSIG